MFFILTKPEDLCEIKTLLHYSPIQLYVFQLCNLSSLCGLCKQLQERECRLLLIWTSRVDNLVSGKHVVPVKFLNRDEKSNSDGGCVNRQI